MARNPARLREHTEKEWEEVRPIIQHLYLKMLKPLPSVIQTMATSYQFNARQVTIFNISSIAMYKRKFRVWALYKNKIKRSRAQPLASTTVSSTSGRPKYLPQNDVDETFHTLLDLLTPWIRQANMFGNESGRTRYPPRAQHVFDRFTRGIANAVVAFESRNPKRGGVVIRQAFIDLEQTLAPYSRSRFTLQSLFFALAILNLAGLFEISRILVIHATKLVIAYTQIKTTPSGLRYAPRLVDQIGIDDINDSGHINHPLPRIMTQLRVLCQKSDSVTMTAAVLKAWSTYHRASNIELAKLIASRATHREFWTTALTIHVNQTSDGIAHWLVMIQPVMNCLNRLRNYAENHMDDSTSFLTLDYISSVYAVSGNSKFEEIALELVRRTERKSGWSGSEIEALPGAWECSARTELAQYYGRKGEFESGMNCLARIIPDKLVMRWKDLIYEIIINRQMSQMT